jgi:chaperonin cofactor prefoldin
VEDSVRGLEDRVASVEEGVKRLEDGQSRLEDRLTSVEDSVRGLEDRVASVEGDVGELKDGQGRIERRMDSLERRFESLESAMVRGFGELGRFAGQTFEEFVRVFLSESLRRLGEIPEDAELGRGVIDGEEVNLFLEEPLIVGEATGYAESVDEMLKLLRKADLARLRYSREPRKILVILTARRDAERVMREMAEEKGVELIVGKIIE